MLSSVGSSGGTENGQIKVKTNLPFVSSRRCYRVYLLRAKVDLALALEIFKSKCFSCRAV